MPELKAGEKYIIKYTANISVDNSGNWDGAATVNNTAKATIKVESKETWSSVEISKAMISKTGGYDSDKNEINWIVTLNKGKKDIQGYKFYDKLPDGIQFIGNKFDVIDTATNQSIGTATVGADGSIEYTFGTDKSYTSEYRITYKTTAPAENGKVNNTGTIGKDGTGNSSTAGVDVTHRNWGVSKNYKNEEDADNVTKKLTWSTTVSLPDSELGEFTYKDTILDANSPNDHYAVASELQADIEKSFVLQLSDDSKLSYNNDKVTLSVTYYDASGNAIEPTDTTQKVKSFEIKITPKSETSIKAKYMILDAYSTYADVSQMQPGTSLAFKNKAELPEHKKESEAQHTIKKDKILSKQSMASWGRDYNKPQISQGNESLSGFSDGSKEMSYDSLNDGYIYYRILINPEGDDDITFTDLLPDGLVVDETSVEGWFYFEPKNYFYCWNAWAKDNQDGKYYSFTDNKKPVVVVDKDNNKMTVTIKNGYNYAMTSANQVNWKLAITYRASIKDEWKDLNLTDKTYVNKVEWGSNSDSQTTTVTRPTTKVEKTAVVETEQDAKGTISAYYAAYSVVINPSGANMNPYADTLSLSDTLTLPQGVTAYLDLDNTGLYYYDASKADYKGTELSSTRYTLQYDEQKNVLNLVVPDETACVFVYRYRIECGAAHAPEISNKVRLYGKFESSTSTIIQNQESGASVNKGSLKIYKVDSDDYTNLLSGAEIEKYDSQSNTWSLVSDDNHSDGKYISNAKGEVELPKEFVQETSYRLKETKAPSGYSKLSNPIYFVFMKANTTKESTINAMSSVFSAARVDADKVKFYETTSKDAVMYVPNENTEIVVKKVWENKNGSTLVNPPTDSIKVTVYRQEQQLAKWTVTVIKKYQEWDGQKQKTLGSFDIAKGSAFTIKLLEQTKGQLSEELQDQCIPVVNNRGKVDHYELRYSSISEDVTIVVEYPNQYASNDPSAYEYDKPEAYESISGSREIAETSDGTKLKNVSLTASNKWSVSWSDLPATVTDADGNTFPYYYTVEETVNIPGYKTTYLNNSGIQTGIIYITNQKEDDKITLPETGGTGTYWYTMGGVLLIAGAAFLIYIKHMRKGGKRIW